MTHVRTAPGSSAGRRAVARRAHRAGPRPGCRAPRLISGRLPSAVFLGGLLLQHPDAGAPDRERCAVGRPHRPGEGPDQRQGHLEAKSVGNYDRSLADDFTSFRLGRGPGVRGGVGRPDLLRWPSRTKQREVDAFNAIFQQSEGAGDVHLGPAHPNSGRDAHGSGRYRWRQVLPEPEVQDGVHWRPGRIRPFRGWSTSTSATRPGGGASTSGSISRTVSGNPTLGYCAGDGTCGGPRKDRVAGTGTGTTCKPARASKQSDRNGRSLT